MEYSIKVQIALLSFGMHYKELCLEEFEPAQILITIDRSWHSLSFIL